MCRRDTQSTPDVQEGHTVHTRHAGGTHGPHQMCRRATGPHQMCRRDTRSTPDVQEGHTVHTRCAGGTHGPHQPRSHSPGRSMLKPCSTAWHLSRACTLPPLGPPAHSKHTHSTGRSTAEHSITRRSTAKHAGARSICTHRALILQAIPRKVEALEADAALKALLHALDALRLQPNKRGFPRPLRSLHGV